jgi:hypothetical protein
MSLENNTIDISSPSSITFDESKFTIKSRRILGELEVPTMIKVLVNRHIVKNEKQAVTLMLALVVILIIISIFLFTKFTAVKPAIPSPELSLNNR